MRLLKITFAAAVFPTCWQRSSRKIIKFIIADKIGPQIRIQKESKSKNRHKSSTMIKKSADFNLEMFQKIEEAAQQNKTTTADIIRKAISFTMKNFQVSFYNKQHLYRNEINKGFTQKRKVIHFTFEQASFIEKISRKYNLFISEVIRICVDAFFKNNLS